jgi:uncharacterized protein YjgD (DUF1641 family)
MASPITFKPAVRDPREALRLRIDQAPGEHAEAVLAAFDVLQLLHDRGVLDIVRGALAAGDEILDVAVEQLNTPQAIRAVRHLLAISGALAEVRVDRDAPLGLWALVRRLHSKDSLRGLAAAVDLMEGFGRHLQAMQAERPGEKSS